MHDLFEDKELGQAADAAAIYLDQHVSDFRPPSKYDPTYSPSARSFKGCSAAEEVMVESKEWGRQGEGAALRSCYDSHR